MSKLKIGINGMGRIGRQVFKLGFKDLDIRVVNATSSPENVAHFLKYDSLQGVWSEDLGFDEKNLILNKKKISCIQEKDVKGIDWKKWGVDVVIECTGKFKKKEDWNFKDLKMVMVSAPAVNPDFTLVYGVNDKDFDKKNHQFISNASCTTNCLAPLVKVLQENFGVEQAFFSTIHSYTNDQRLLDSSHKDLRRARAAALNIIPTSSGAGKALSLIFPSLEGKVSGLAYRVPTGNVSLLDVMVKLKKQTSLEDVKKAFLKSSKGDLKKVLCLEEAPLVSSDFIGRKESVIVDFPLSDLKGELLKLSAWYDNEVGFSQRMLDFLLKCSV